MALPGEPSPAVLLGGPDQPPRALRDLLQARVDRTGPGGAIDWMTYYFRDEALAEALVRAHRRGAAVRVCVEGAPRSRGANDAVIARLREGIGPGLRAVRHRLPCHLHTKLYAFSHPRPVALVGSFNPSGNAPEDAATLAAIGDQDRGHNLLVEVSDPAVVAALTRRVAAVHAGAGAFRLALGPGAARIGPGARDGVLFPYLPANPLHRRLDALRPGATLRLAASHVRDPFLVARLGALARRGVRTTLLTHHTPRRAPPRIARRLGRDGVAVLRYAHPEDLPMHAKFLLAEDGAARWAAFGSYNFTLTSRWLNQEALLFSDDPALWSALDRRWAQILAEPWTRPAGAPPA